MISGRTESSTLFTGGVVGLADSIIINRPLDFRSYSGLNLGAWLAGCRSGCRSGFLRGLAPCARVPLHSVAERGLMENPSLVNGLEALLLIAALFYLLAGIGLRNASTSESTVLPSTGERDPDSVPDSV